MRLLLVSILFFAGCICAPGQSNKPTGATTVPAPTGTAAILKPPAYETTLPVNYVRVWEPQRPYPLETDVTSAARTVEEVRKTTRYADGIGRPLQTVAWQQSTDKKDVVMAAWYDEAGRETYRFLPFVSSAASGSPDNDGNLKYDPFGQQKTFAQAQYPGEQYYYSKTITEASPLGRPLQSFAPGNAWAGSEKSAQEHAVSVTYDANGSNEVRLWTVTSNTLTYTAANEITPGLNLPASSGWYAAGTLYRTTTTDEEGNKTVSYTDKQGRTVLKKVQTDKAAAVTAYTGWLNTYYVYDALGQLRAVLPPKATEALAAGTWQLTTQLYSDGCFVYEYDARRRPIAKRVPGAAWTYMVYDDKDRLVFSQDGNLRGRNWWLTTLYDELDRPVLTGIITGTSTLTHPGLTGNMTSLAYSTNTTLEGMAVNANPVPAGATLTAETKTHYDSYGWTTSTYTNTESSVLQSSPANVYAEQMTTQNSPLVRGLATGTEVRMLTDAANPGAGGWLTSVTFYDAKARPVQVKATNSKGGTDITSTLYNWAGKPVSSYTEHSNPQIKGSDASLTTKRVATDLTYDHTGKVTEVRKRLFTSSSTLLQTVRIAKNSYDRIGQLLTKSIGQQRNSDGVYVYTAVEQQDYAYNIRGWLRGINKDYTAPATAVTSRWWGEELTYDFGFDKACYGGNISGAKWRSRGDGESRAYGFGYDNASRLLYADFNQYTGGAYNRTAGADFSVSNLTYDANGNIGSMKQMGLKLNSSIAIDQLKYTYPTGSNQLQTVTDTANDNTSLLGDFKYDGSAKTTTDYGYDASGNLISDKNKKIGSIVYNYLNLPMVITVTGKGTIAFSYDAMGNKLKKVVTDNTVSPARTTTTDYIGAFTYQNDTLQFIATEEGRMREKGTAYNFDYFLKDHLGNVRMVLTDEQRQDVYPAATMENTAGINVQKYYYYINVPDTVGTARLPWWNTVTNKGYFNNNGNPPFNTDNTVDVSAVSQIVYKINGSTGNKTGMNMALKVMSGDVVDIWGKSVWHSTGTNPVNSYSYSVSSVLSAFINGFAGASAATGAAAKGATGAALNASPTTTAGVQSFLDNVPTPAQASVPKAYLNWILFDEQFRVVRGGSDLISTAPDAVKSHHVTVNLASSSSGYMYIYCSNESNVNVYWDNIQVIHTRGPLLEETHYYPFGLTMSGISSKALAFGEPGNRKKFNDGSELENKEFSDGSGLELYATEFRKYDPQVGRFTSIDGLSDLSFDISPYAYCNNNPILLNDPLGLMGDTIVTNHPEQTPGFNGNTADLQGVTVTSTKSLDTKNGQVYPEQSPFWDILNGNRTFTGHYRIGNNNFTLNWEVNSKGYLTGKTSPNQLIFTAPVDRVPLNLKAVFNLKNFIKGNYVIYKYNKLAKTGETLPYIGKALNSLASRYGSEQKVFDMGVEIIAGLDKVPNNAITLGIEQLTIDLNGGVGTGSLSNINNATIKEIYINEARYWLDNNLPNWESVLKVH